MRPHGDLLIHNVEIEGNAGLDVIIRDGAIAEIGINLRAYIPSLDGKGGALIPGLHDHHIHLFALAAEENSLKVGPSSIYTPADFETILRKAARNADAGTFIRAIDYHESVAGSLDRHVLDRIAPHVPLRVQYRTGSLWVLNNKALDLVLADSIPPDCLERDAQGLPNGRIWRGDKWLRSRLKNSPPSLAKTGAMLARYGITALTDTSVSTDTEQAALFEEAVRLEALPQRLTLMSGGALSPSTDRLYDIGCVKIILDEARLGMLDPMVQTIRKARQWNRNVAVHCVTSTELAFTLAAFGEAGARHGDRIEHGGVIDDDAIEIIAELGLTVVTQPGFIAERGDAYLQDVEKNEIQYLYRAASLLKAGIPLAGSSDAPYTNPDPWAAMKAAMERRTANGEIIAGNECLAPHQALALFMGRAENPGGPPRRIAAGEAADLCLLHLPLVEALREPHQKKLAATIIGGRLVWCDS